MCDNIKKILAEHGGYWLTLDHEMSPLYAMIMKAFYGGELTREFMFRSKYRIEDKSDADAVRNSMTISLLGDVQENMKNAMNYIASKGLKLERLPFAEHVPEFKSLEKADSNIVAQIKEGFKRVCIWKITVDESDTVDISAGTESFNADASIDGDRLNLILSGNLDTLSAPKLLANYEKIKKDNALNSVFIDCSKLEYVSSAGLRVLLIMNNDCDGGVIMNSCNEVVIEALADTNIKILNFHV